MASTYTITLCDDHVAAIQAKIATLQTYDSNTKAMVQTFADETAYMTALLKNDVQSLGHFIPAVVTAEQARDTAMTTLQSAVGVTKVTS